MSRLTLQLPETLHRQPEAQAKREGVSLNQYIVYALSRQHTQSYTVRVVPEEAVAQQQTRFTVLLRDLGEASPEAMRVVLAARLRARLAATASDPSAEET